MSSVEPSTGTGAVRSLALLLAALTAVRLAVAAVAPLAPDEAYYWIWSRALQPGYLDHPPMVASWIRAGTALAGPTALGVRLLGPVAALAGSVLLADAAERLFPGRRLGLPAAALLNATLMVGAGAVTMTPDTPLVLFTVLTLWALVRVQEDGRWWVLVGVAAGLALDSKYTAVLLGVAVPVWLLLGRRWAELRTPWPWAGGVAAAACFAPVVLWNAEHGWVSFVKQGGRSADWTPALALRFVPELLGGQVALATPLVFGLFALGVWRTCRSARAPGCALLVALVVPGLLLFGQHALGGRVQGNWLAVLYPPLAVGAAWAQAGAGRRWWRPAAALGLLITGVVYLQAATGVVPLPRGLDPTLIRLGGWDGLARDAEAMRAREGLGFVAADDYAAASELAWWMPAGTRVVGVEARWRLFSLPRAAGGAGLLLISARRREGPDPAEWAEAREIGELVRARAGVEAERFRVYRAVLRNGAPAVELSR